MTTIYELDKQATPAPWAHESDMIDVSDQAQMLLDNIGTDREWQAIGINDAEGFAEVTALCHPEHAKLLVHYHNHFMEALEVLKHAHTSLRTFTWSPHWTTSDDGTLALIEKTIDEMETVE